MNIWKNIWVIIEKDEVSSFYNKYKMKIKILSILSILFLISCQNEYVENYENNTQYEASQIQIEQWLENFSVEKISEFEDIELFYTPQTKSFPFLDILVWKIDWAQDTVYLETYIFTEKRIFEALKKAQKRWINVKVLMEKNVYKAPFLNNTRYNDLEKAWVNVTWSNPENYSLNHTKMLIIDNEVIVSTGNYSYSSFAYNREFFIQIRDTDFVNKLTQVFDADFEWKKFSIYDDRLILSPDMTRTKFSTLVDSAQESIKIYSQTFSDDILEEQLSQRQADWINVEIIFPELSAIASNTESYNIFEDAWISIYTMKKPKLHAKALLIDDKYLYLWSINFSYYSIEENREIWLIITNPEIIEKFLWVWEWDKKQ